MHHFEVELVSGGKREDKIIFFGRELLVEDQIASLFDELDRPGDEFVSVAHSSRGHVVVLLLHVFYPRPERAYIVYAEIISHLLDDNSLLLPGIDAGASDRRIADSKWKEGEASPCSDVCEGLICV
jgi:hypothetical protein